MMISESLQLKQSNSSVRFKLVITTLHLMTHLGLIEVLPYRLDPRRRHIISLIIGRERSID